MADYLGSPCTAVYAAEDLGALEQHLNFCRNLRIEAKPIECSEQAKSVAAYAREASVTQVYVTRNAPDVVRLVNLVRDMQVTIVAERSRD